MAGTHLDIGEGLQGPGRPIDCVEIYMPKTLEFLSELYNYLRRRVNERLGPIVLDGFSIYEVDGYFRGEKVWEQRTLIIRVLYIRPTGSVPALTATWITELGRELASTVAINEEEIWICHYPQTLTIFRGLRRVLRQE